VDQVVEAKACVKWRSGGILRTGALLAAAAFASMLMVDLPVAASGADGEKADRSYVPAGDKWIELGAPQRPAASPWSGSASDRLHADLLRSPAADARDPKPRQSRRKPRAHS
jgi:hypothetical protein